MLAVFGENAGRNAGNDSAGEPEPGDFVVVALEGRLPSPFAFDHVIVRAGAGGKTRWIDPTIAHQGGTVETIDAPDDGTIALYERAPEIVIPILRPYRGPGEIGTWTRGLAR